MVDIPQFEKLLLDEFSRVRAELGRHFPDTVIKVYATAIGSATNNEGRIWVIDCVIPAQPTHLPDNISLVVSVDKIRTAPELNADVSWGDPAGVIEEEAFEQARLLSDSSIQELNAELPRLYAALQKAILRRSPKI